MLNSHYKDILSILSEKKVKFLLVGAYAMAAHGFPRSTMDIDILVMPSPDNASLVLQSLDEFGAFISDLTVEDLQQEGLIFQIGVAPCRVDILTSIDGVTFERAYSNSKLIEIEGIPIHVLSIPDIIINKKSTGRKKDIIDIEMLEENLQ